MTSYVVAGASRGIGLEFVRQLSAAPETVVFALVRNKGTATRLTDLGRKNVHVLQADITDVKALNDAATAVGKVTGGKLDMLINNGALLPNSESTRTFTLSSYPEGAEEQLSEDLRASFDTNVIGVAHTVNVFLPLLRAGATKKVITITSGAGDADDTVKKDFPYFAPYSISKAAVNMVVAKFAAEFKKEGFVFLALSPGAVNTSTAPPTEEEKKFMQLLAPYFLNAAPDFKGPMQPEQSVEMMRKVIDSVTVAESGAFISHKGNKEWL